MADPPVKSLAREERIARRRARIESRLKEKQRTQEGTDESKFSSLKLAPEPEEKEMSKGLAQIKKGQQSMEKVKDNAFEAVTSILLAEDSRETQRREAELEIKTTHQEKLTEEAASSEKANAEIAMKWEPLLEHSMPEELHEALKEQKDRCEEIIGSKNEVLDLFNADLKRKNDEYVKVLKRESQAIDTLIKRMREHLTSLRKSYEEELEQIERAFSQEHAEMIEGNRNEIEGLMEKRRNKEIRFMEARQDRIEEQQRQLDQLRTQDAEEYAIIKVKLETWLQDLEQQLEEMRAVYQLNNEKLIYNCQVLKDRGVENGNTISVQKKKLTRLQDVLSNLKAKYHSIDKEFRQRNISLTEEYRRITEQFKDLQTKVRHFERADERRYREVWELNQNIVVDKAKLVLQADKVIHEQQLGLNWIPPDDRVFDPSVEARELQATTADAEGRGGPSESSPAEGDPAESLSRPPHSPGAVVGEGEGQRGGTPADEMGRASRLFDSTIHSAGRSFSSEEVKSVLSIVSKEAGFLLEDKIRRVLQGIENDEERDLITMDAVSRALHVEKDEDLARLVTCFREVAQQRKNDEDKKRRRQERLGQIEKHEDDHSDGEGNMNLLALITPEDASLAIKTYIERSEQIRHSQTAPPAGDDDADGERYKTPKEKEQEWEYWDRMARVVPQKTERVWQAVEHALGQYHELLKKRSNLAQDCSDLHRQNEELKQLLSRYLKAKVNEDLEIPPIQTLTLAADPVHTDADEM